MSSSGWPIWAIVVLICINIIQMHWSCLKLLKREDLHFHVGCSKPQAQNQKLSRFSFIIENKPPENFYTRVDTCCCHSSGIQTDFSSQKQVRIDCRLLQKKVIINVSHLCSSLPQLTNRNTGTRQILGRRRQGKEVERDLPSKGRITICSFCCGNRNNKGNRGGKSFKSVS